MKTKEIDYFTFEELDEVIQQKVLDTYSYINVDGFDWWKFCYEDAANVGIKITSFDIDLASYCTFDKNYDIEDIAENIIAGHGKQCETYKHSIDFLKNYDRINKEIDTCYENDLDDDNLNDELGCLIETFEMSLSGLYLELLKREYHYLISDEAIKETIILNEYYFTSDGEIE